MERQTKATSSKHCAHPLPPPSLSPSLFAPSDKQQTNFQTRWNDNDIFGHMNNTKYLELFDTVINTFLINKQVLDLSPKKDDEGGNVVGFCVESHCNYYAPLAFPQTLTLGLKVQKLGSSSVVYHVGVFTEEFGGGGDKIMTTNPEAKASGHFVHVFVDQSTSKSVKLPSDLREALETIT
jgi:acyl-CoA thioester hydrolase